MTGNDVDMQPEEDQLEGGGNSPKRCAACKYLRRRCAHDCVLAPYFPASHPHRYACVHRVFGASNVARLLQSLPVEERGQAAESLAMEAQWRVGDPVYGCTGIINRLQEEILVAQCELARTRAQLDMAAARLQLQQQAPVPPPPPPRWPQPAGDHHHVAVAQRQDEAPFLDPDEFLDLDAF
ncbi:LOB domain-containing protein 24-like [Lolium rigidum]|uniref:LOB domain-containing protein 24-like n=1 Tax=Lolium rigidum TaxID=89674 RepID=UPI001F5D318E|nr:LOB domain-containing protein 24-like [Lolium rigidum]